jgi:type IV pilus assembly protein PilQ
MSRLPKDPVSLDYENTDVRDVIKLLAAKAKINIIYGPDVGGTLTLHLSDVPFNEAFRTVLSMMQLSTDQVGDNVMRVITPAALTSQRTSAAAVTKVIPMNYSKASEVKATIDAVRVAEGRTGSSSVDSKTNSLVVTESLEGLLATENLISQLDQRPKQVLIEAKLVEVNVTNELNYGIQWDAFGQDRGSVGGRAGTTLVGSPAGLVGPSVTNPLNSNAIQTNIAATGAVGASGRGTGVGLAADRVFGALTLGRVTNNYLLNATITAAASEGKAKVLSDPKIATLNNQAANINVTTQIPYVTSNVASTGVQTQTVSYVTTGIQLSVIPSINADGRILLNINPNVSQPSVTASANTLTGAPATDSRNATTTVLVRDGETIVIGGLISDSLQDTISKIPILGDIPILGWLFKKKSKKRVRNELLIFVTTHVLSD